MATVTSSVNRSNCKTLHLEQYHDFSVTFPTHRLEYRYGNSVSCKSHINIERLTYSLRLLLHNATYCIGVCTGKCILPLESFDYQILKQCKKERTSIRFQRLSICGAFIKSCKTILSVCITACYAFKASLIFGRYDKRQNNLHCSRHRIDSRTSACYRYTALEL